MLTGASGADGAPPSAGLQSRFLQTLQGVWDFWGRSPFSLPGPAVNVPLLQTRMFRFACSLRGGRGTCELAVSNKAMCLETPMPGQSEPLGSVLQALQQIPTFSPLWEGGILDPSFCQCSPVALNLLEACPKCRFFSHTPNLQNQSLPFNKNRLRSRYTFKLEKRCLGAQNS